jgi:hypothetical protein
MILSAGRRVSRVMHGVTPRAHRHGTNVLVLDMRGRYPNARRADPAVHRTSGARR